MDSERPARHGRNQINQQKDAEIAEMCEADSVRPGKLCFLRYLLFNEFAHLVHWVTI